MQVDVARTVLELANFAPNHEEKGAIVELPKVDYQKPQKTTNVVEVVVETNENLLEILDDEVKETEMVVIALEIAEKNVCKLIKRIIKNAGLPVGLV